ncbi:GNAT family N-acetyltransferase [Faunimonas pinastri]|uniref:GNAT family N-acetyltransferase n=1 Tax=Faunimonas pinastri TaxID=1855383 RepID=UPI00115F7A48|nr:GNAT family N-acetyltransferase [Faunimonas pinastri]
MLTIERETPDQADAARFLAQADERSRRLYPTDDRSGMTLSQLLQADVRFFVARSGDVALGCGGYVRISDSAAEMKRLFVDPQARGQGVGSALIAAIERSASKEGATTLLLETGVQSAKARHLYRRLGYREQEAFPPYAPDPLSIFMGKELVKLR